MTNTLDNLERIEFEHEEANKMVKAMRKKLFRSNKKFQNWVEVLKGKDAINEKGAYGFTLLMHAVMTLRPKLISLLVKNGADPTIHADDGLAPVHVAAELNKPDYLKALLINKEVANAQNEIHSLPPLDHAVSAEREKNILLLLEMGADINLQSRSGNPAITNAITPTSFKFGRLLLKHGADPFIKNNGDVSYVDYMSRWLKRDRNILTENGQNELDETIKLLRELHPGCL